MSLITKSGEIRKLFTEVIQDNNLTPEMLYQDCGVPAAQTRAYIRRKTYDIPEKNLIKLLNQVGVDVRISVTVGELPSMYEKKKVSLRNYNGLRHTPTKITGASNGKEERCSE